MTDREISLLRNDIIRLQGALDHWKQSWNRLHRDNKQLEQELQKTREQLEKCENSLMKVACFETHGENKYINHEQAYTGVANFARQYFQDKDKQGEGWMSKLDFFQRLDIYDINGDAVSKKTFNAVKELQEQNKILIEALEFYAENKNWEQRESGSVKLCAIDPVDHCQYVDK